MIYAYDVCKVIQNLNREVISHKKNKKVYMNICPKILALLQSYELQSFENQNYQFFKLLYF